jgi:hypothetical protein
MKFYDPYSFDEMGRTRLRISLITVKKEEIIFAIL